MDAMRMLVLHVVFMAIACTSCVRESTPCETQPQTDQAKATYKDDDSDARVMKIADEFAAVHRQTLELEYRLDVTSGEPPKHIWCVARHAPDHELDLQVFDGDRLVFELHKCPNGTNVSIREKNYLSGESAEYEVPRYVLEAGEWSVRCRQQLNPCMFGTSTVSWVGPKAINLERFERFIRCSKYVGTCKLEGHLCDVLKNNRVGDLHETFCIDQQGRVIRQWKHVVREVTRDRVFTEIRIVPPKRGEGV